MILRRVIEHTRKQEWTAIFIDLVIVVVGVFIGIQVSNWNIERETNRRAAVFTERLKADLRVEAWGYDYLIEYNKDILANTEPPQLQRTRTRTARSDALDGAIKAASAAMKARLKREPKAAEVIQYLESEAHPDGPVVDYLDDAIIWVDAKGKCQTTLHKTIQNRLTAIRKRS